MKPLSGPRRVRRTPFWLSPKLLVNALTAQVGTSALSRKYVRIVRSTFSEDRIRCGSPDEWLRMAVRKFWT